MFPQITVPLSPFLKNSSLYKWVSLIKINPFANHFLSLMSNPAFCLPPANDRPKSASCANELHDCSNCAKVIATFTLCLFILLLSSHTKAQVTYGSLQVLKVNPLITTIITANEPIEIVDMSTDNVIGEKTLDNTLMIKPVSNDFKDGEFIATLTIITERYRVQYGLVYTEDLTEAVADKQLSYNELTSFKNPEIKMSKEEMHFYASRIWFSSSRIRNISSSEHKMKIRLNNLYSIGGYFFLDFSVENKTNIPFDIDEIRLKLSDKKIAKATNNQIIEILPEMILIQDTQLKKNYRNVLVIPKLTFPNDKVLTLEISEQQISGRTIKLNIDYEDVLSADAFSNDLLIRR